MALASVVVPAERNKDMDNPLQKGLGLSLDSLHRISELVSCCISISL